MVGIVVAEGFPFSATVVCPTNLPLAHINEIKAIVKKSINARTPANRMVR
jgi:hypothetical protein